MSAEPTPAMVIVFGVAKGTLSNTELNSYHLLNLKQKEGFGACAGRGEAFCDGSAYADV